MRKAENPTSSLFGILVVLGGKEDTTSEEAKKWAPAYENYTFTADGAMTRFSVDVDTDESLFEFFSDVWPKALEKLKEIAERLE